MDNNSAPGPEPEPSPKAPFHVTHSHKFTYGYLAVLIFAAIIGITYTWQHDKVVELNRQLSTALSSPPKATTTNPTYIKDVSVGYPKSLPIGGVLTTLYLPSGTDLIQSTTSLSTQADLGSVFANSTSDILGYWNFMPQGTTTKPDQATDPVSQIYLTSMDSWESTADTTTVLYPSTTPNPAGTKMTVAQKQSFVSKLNTSTKTCAANSSEGFATSNKTYNVCYSLEKPEAKGGNYILYIDGYGQLKNTPVYIGGNIQLPNAYQSEMSSYIKALKNITSVLPATAPS
jgi:hypothetical protein